MSRKAFLIWGLIIIQFYVTVMAIVTYLGVSKIIDLKESGLYIGLFQLIMPISAFGSLLFMRFKSIGRKKRTLAVCLPFYLFSSIATTSMAGLYMEIVDFSGQAMMPFVNGITEGGGVKTWIKIKFVLYLVPAHYLGMWSLFVLLWFGSHDPRTPSKNGFIRFIKHGFARKSGPSVQTHVSELAHS